MRMLPFKKSERKFSSVLSEVRTSMGGQGLSLGELLERLGEGGLLTFCMVLTIPFLLPVSIPGTSTPFGLLMALVSAGLILNRPPWLPAFLMKRQMARAHLAPALEKGAVFFERLEKWIHPRWGFLTGSLLMQRLNGLAMLVAAVFLMAPMPLPLANALPAYSVLFLAVGCLERDGWAILAGDLMLAATTAYFSLIAFVGWAGLKALAAHLWLA